MENTLFYENIKLIETSDYKLIDDIFKDKNIDQYQTLKNSIELFKKNIIYRIENLSGDNIGIAALYAVDESNHNACIDAYVNGYFITEIKQAVICLLKYVFEDLNFEKLYTVFSYDNRSYNEFWNALRFVNGALLRNHKKMGTEYTHLFTKNILRHEYMRFFKNDNNIKKVLHS